MLTHMTSLYKCDELKNRMHSTLKSKQPGLQEQATKSCFYCFQAITVRIRFSFRVGFGLRAKIRGSKLSQG